MSQTEQAGVRESHNQAQVMRPFHLAFKVRDLEEARSFYERIPGCKIARSGDKWTDFNFLGHQITAHLSGEINDSGVFNLVDQERVPVPHFGVIVTGDEFVSIKNALVDSGVEFLIKPTVRFRGRYAEQQTMFFKDPSGNCLEIKSFSRQEEMF